MMALPKTGLPVRPKTRCPPLRQLRQCFALLLLLGCTPGHNLPPVPAGSGEYRLGPGDAVRLITFGEDGLTGDFRVSDAGTIAVPLLGGVRAAGLTPAELEVAVADKLKQAKL